MTIAFDDTLRRVQFRSAVLTERKTPKKCHETGLFRDTPGSKNDTLIRRTKLAFYTVCHACQFSE